jgi:NAD-dependent histone deacetylase SIR2
MLIIMGTSLKVHGLKKLVKDFAKTVHASNSGGKPLSPKNMNKSKTWAGKVIFVNRTPPPAGEWSDIIDYHVVGDTDTWVDKVIEDWKKMRPADWEVQKTLDGADGEDSPFKVVKDVVKTKGMSFEDICWIYTHVNVVSAGKKKPEVDVENIPPPLDPIPIQKPNQVTPPVSPSKRRQAASHYSDLESSPSKKRDISAATLGIQKLAIEERGLLFGNDSTNAKTVEVGSGKVKLSAGGRPGKPGKVISEVTKQKMEMWVEVEMVK